MNTASSLPAHSEAHQSSSPSRLPTISGATADLVSNEYFTENVLSSAVAPKDATASGIDAAQALTDSIEEEEEEDDEEEEGGATFNKPSSNNKKRSKPTSQPPMITMSTISSSSAMNNCGIGAAGENTGRWTAEEHRLFLQGLDEHGKGWKKIAALIKSRTVVQIRTHAQKYFQKLAKARQNGEDGEPMMMDCRISLSMMDDPLASTSSSMRKKQQEPFSFNRGTTKRKSIASIVASVTREQTIPPPKRDHSQQDNENGEEDDDAPTKDTKKVIGITSVAPALLPFIPLTSGDENEKREQTTDEPATLLSASVLEESL